MSFPTKRRARRAAAYIAACCALLALPVASCSDQGITEPTRRLSPAGAGFSAAIALNTRVVYLGAPNSQPINFIRGRVYDENGATIGSVDQNLDPTRNAFDFSLNVQLPGARSTKARMTLELANRGAGGEVVQYSGRIQSLPLAPGDFRQVDIDLYPGPLDNFDVRGVHIAKPIRDIVEGDSVVAAASVDGGSANTRVVWSSLDATIATIDNGGRIRGVSAGVARVVAAVGTLADTASVKVMAKRAGVVVTPPILEVDKVGDIGVYTATVVDKNGNAIADEPVLWSIADQSIGSFVSTATVQGMRVGQTTVTARAANDTSLRGTAMFRVKPQDARVARVDVSPSAATLRTIGATQSFVATARDSAGNIVPNVAVSWTSTGSTVATINQNGVATAVARGTTSIVATVGSFSGRASLEVNPSASGLELVGGDTQIDTVARQLRQPFAVRTVDRAGNAVGGVPVQFSPADGASVSVANATSNSEGIAQTQVTLGRTPGVYHVSARADSLTGSPITITATALGGSPYALEIERQPSSPAQNRVPLTTQPIVRVVDMYGNRALHATPQIMATPDSGTADGSTATINAATGLATYSSLSLGGRIGDRTIRFSSGSLRPVSARVTLVAGAPASITAVSGATQVAQAGAPVSTVPSVRVLDVDGNPIAGATITFAVTVGNGSILNVTATTDSTGAASVGGWTLGATAGTNTLAATVGNLTTTFTATGTAGAPSSTGSTMHVSATTITAGSATPITVTIQLRDAGGNALTSSGGVVAIASTLGTVSSVVDNGNGSYTATLTAPQTTGSALLTATLGGQPLTSSATVAIQPGAPSATTTTVSVGSTALNANGTTTITITVRDAYGNIVTNVAPSSLALSSSIGTIGTVTCTNGVCTAAYTAPASSGTAAIGMSVGGAPVASAPSIVVSAVPGVVTGLTATPGNAQVSLAWAAPSNGGLPITDYLIEYSSDGVIWTTFAHGASTTTNITVAGLTNGTAYRFRVSAVSAIGTGAPSSSVNATPTSGGTPQLAVNGGNNQTAVAGSAVATAPSVKALDANNNPVQGVSVTFSVASGSGSVTGGTMTTDAAGIATLGSWTLGTTAGANSLTASASGYTGATINATGAVGAAAATTSTISASPTSLTANGSATSTLIVRLRDVNGNDLTTGGATVTFAAASVGSIGPVTDNGDGTYTATYTAGSTAGNVTIQPKLGGTNFTNTATIGLTAGSATRLVLTTNASGSASGMAFTTQPVVQIRDASNVLVGGSTANVTMSVSSNGVVVGTSTVAAINGVATFTNVGISGTAGTSYTLTFTSAGLTQATQLITPTVGAAAKLTIVTSAAGAVNGTAFTTQPVIEIEDAFGNRTSSSASVTLGASSGATTLGTATVAAVNGQATFANAGITGTSGTAYTLTYTSVGLTPVTQTITPTAAAATKLEIVTSASGSASGAAFTTQPVVEIRDANGTVVSGSAANVTMTVSANGTTVGTTTVAAVNGVATFTDVGISGTASTSYTLTFASAGLTSATQTVTPTAGAPAKLALNTAAAGAQNGSAFTTVPVVEIEDAFGNRTSSTATVSIASSNGGTLSGTTSVAAASGRATFAGVGLTGTAGTAYTLTYTSTGLTQTTQTISATAGSASKLAIITAAAGASNGSAFSTQPIIEIEDAYGSRTTSTANVTLAVSGGATTLGTVTVAAVAGRATFSDVGISGTAGTSYTITYSSPSLTDTTQSITAAVGVDNKLALTTNAAGAASGAAFSTQPVVEIRDAQGSRTSSTASVTMTVNNSGTVVGTSTVTAVNGVATFTDVGIGGISGTTYTLTFASTGLSSTTQTIVPTAGAAAKLAVTTQAASAASGAAFGTQPVVEIQDAVGNRTASTATVTMAVSSNATTVGTVAIVASSGTATYSGVGISGTAGTSYTLTFSSAGLTSATQSITPTAGAPDASTSTLSIGSTTLVASGTTTITVTVKDAFGNVVTTATPSGVGLASDVGSIGTASCTNGVCTATFTAPGGNGTATITAKIGGTNVVSSPATVTIASAAGAPTGLAATSNQSAQVPLTWTAPASDGGSAITNYLVEYSANGGTSWSTFAHSASTATSITVTGLTNGTLYSFRVSAINAVGTSSASTTATATPVGAPDAPTNLVATPGTAQAALTWTAPANDGGAAITDYVIEYSSNGGTSWATFAHTVSAATSITVTGLTNGTSYTFRVSAKNASGAGAASTTTTATPGAPGAPTNLGVALNQVSSTSHTGALTWTAPSSTGGSAITDYVIEYKQTSSSTWIVVSHSAQTTTSYSISGLANSTGYDFRVAAKNSVGTGPYSAIASGTTTGPSERLQCQTAGNSNSNSITASVLPCTGVKVGDIIVIPVAITNSGSAKTITSNDGFTPLTAVQNSQDSQNYFQTTVFYKIATAADVGRGTAYSFTWSGNEKSIITLVAYKNVDGSAPSMTSATGMSATMAAPTGPNMTTASHTLLYFYLQNIALSSTTPSISEWAMTMGSPSGPSDLFKNTTAGANNANAIGVLTADIDKFAAGTTSTVENTKVTANSASKAWTAIVLGIHP